MSFNQNPDPQVNTANETVTRTLTNLDRDCFIIPVHSLDRFLPAGVPLPVGKFRHSWLLFNFKNVNI